MKARGLPCAMALAACVSLHAQITDHHQHLYSPDAGANSSSVGARGISAQDLIRALDAAGIHRAAVLSVAYSFGNPNKPAFANEYALVKAENDWTGQQAALYPDRLRGLCSVNPLRLYALDEIGRCAKNLHLRTGLKLHFGNSDVDVTNAEHLLQLRRVFRAANAHRMAIVVHVRPTVSRRRPYGAEHARIFVERLLPEAPDVTVQIAHLAGAGGYDDRGQDEAVGVYAEAIAGKDPRMKNVYFDCTSVAGLGNWKNRVGLIAKRMRELGLRRLLYGSDAPVSGNLPADALTAWRQLPLTPDEFRIIGNNVAPYLRDWRDTSSK
jgi:predicted TIM-barrel fold metal-dependent hydrolase